MDYDLCLHAYSKNPLFCWIFFKLDNNTPPLSELYWYSLSFEQNINTVEQGFFNSISMILNKLVISPSFDIKVKFI